MEQLELDFSGISAGSSLSYLTSGLHKAVIADYNYFKDDNVLYAYLDTNGVQHRTSFRLEYDGGKKALLRFFTSAGIDPKKLEDKKIAKGAALIEKTKGRTVYFNYTAPTTDESGRAVEGSYAKYDWYTEARWNAVSQMMNEESTATEKKKTNGGGAPIVEKVKDDEGFDFLLNDA